MDNKSLKKSKEPDTIIHDRRGWAHEGYLCDKYCVACPYVVEDCMGEDACYADQYQRCQHND